MESQAAIASFEAKWAVAYPELALALRFFPPSQRVARSAFACIAYEIAHAAFRIREPQVAATKLQWWAEELVAMHAGQARHPLTQALAAHVDLSRLPGEAWQPVVVGAIAQRDALPASTFDRLLDEYLKFYRPLATVESALLGGIDAPAQADAQALSRALHETIVLSETLESGRLALPLDLLARHQLARGDLAQASPARAAALCEFFALLAGRMRRIDWRGLSPLAVASLHADRQRCCRAERAKDPLAASGMGLDRLPLSTVWMTWRAARRVQV
jgi:phytoene synthase